MPLSDEEFEAKVNNLVGDVAVAVFKLFNPSMRTTPDYLDNIKDNWKDLSQRFFDLEKD